MRKAEPGKYTFTKALFFGFNGAKHNVVTNSHNQNARIKKTHTMSEMEREPSVKQLKQKHKTNKREKKKQKANTHTRRIRNRRRQRESERVRGRKHGSKRESTIRIETNYAKCLTIRK